FCTDFHDYQDQGGSDRCEASIFIGRGVAESNGGMTGCTASACPGGLLVEATGALDPNQPLVQANGSIVLSQGNSVHRELDVMGPIWARSDCGYGAGETSTGFGGGAPTWATPQDVYAGWDTADTTGQPTLLHCNNYGGTVSPSNSSPTSHSESNA